MKTNDLRDVLFNVFADTRVPDAAEIVPDYWDLDLERARIRDAFGGRAWHELSPGILADQRQALFFFTPKGWAYYLPAYLLAVIDAYDEADTALTEIVHTLTPGPDPEIEVIRSARLAALTEKQRRVLLEFIGWAASEHPDDIDDDDRERLVRAIPGDTGHSPA